MLNQKIEKAINEQINAELYSAYLYLSMQAYFESLNLPGLAKWMYAQTQEEVMHAMKFYNFIIERGGKIVLEAIDKPQTEWDSPLAAFEAAYQHEQKVTARINNLMNMVIEEKDHATNSFLQWFVDEQVEEEASVSAVVQKLNMVEKSSSGLFMVDNELGQRVFTPPQTQGEE